MLAGTKQEIDLLAAPELEPLLADSLDDRTLRQQAFTLGLDQAQLLRHLEDEPPDFAAIGIDERAKVEAAEENLRDAESLVEFRGTRSTQMRLVTFTVAFALVVISSVFAARSISAETWGWFTVCLAAGVSGALCGIVTHGRWPPSAVARWQEAAARSAADAGSELSKCLAELRVLQIEAGIKPALRTYLNSRQNDGYRTTLTLVEQEGLTELEDPRYAIPTKAREQLDRFLNDMPGGSIGLSGPRGVGKTTLIRSVCPTTEKGPQDRFGFVVSAPINFDPREFLLHLFGETCRTLLGARKVEEMRSRHPAARIASKPDLNVLRWGWQPFAFLGLVLLLFSMMGVTILLAIVGGLLLGAALLAALPIGPGRRLRALSAQLKKDVLEPGPLPSVTAVAASRLEDIWYQQTFTTGWSGGLKAGIGEAGLEGSREVAKQQMTLPDIVGDFRDLLSRIAEERRVLIGIDELDKMETRDEAHKFMNEIKVLFGIENCFFLLSVSEDAMSAFERRGMPFRDVFDSAFDDVVGVNFLGVDESISLLQRRVVGMPFPYIFMCHCVAGGLARDVIRVAREVIACNPKGEEGWPLHQACEAIIAADAKAKIRAGQVATRGMPSTSAVEKLRCWLQDMQDAPITAVRLVKECEKEGAELVRELAGAADAAEDGASAPHALGAELLTFLFYAGTLLEFFDPDRSPEGFREAYEDGRVERLARARQALAVHPRMAWESLRNFRHPEDMQLFPVPLTTTAL